jgi:hypothetical protein
MSSHKNLRGNDLHAPSRELVENNTGSTLSPLAVVGLNGMGTVYPQVVLANPGLVTPFGIVPTRPCDQGNGAIVTGCHGNIVTLGFMFDLDSSPWPANTILYSTALGTLSNVPLGSPIAFVVKQDATKGVIYCVASMALEEAVEDADFWTTIGNLGINPATNYIGTNDAQPFKIRTDNNPVGQFDAQGRLAIGAHNPERHVHIKSYPGYTGSGLQVETFAVTVSGLAFASAYTVPMANGEVIKVKFQVTARQVYGVERASFTRSVLLYKQGGNVMIEGGVQTDFTMKSNSNFNVKCVLGVNDATFSVKNATSNDTYWVGHVEIERVIDAT